MDKKSPHLGKTPEPERENRNPPARPALCMLHASVALSALLTVTVNAPRPIPIPIRVLLDTYGRTHSGIYTARTPASRTEARHTRQVHVRVRARVCDRPVACGYRESVK